MKKAWPPLRSDRPATRDRFDLQRLGGHEAVEAIMQRVAARFAHDNLNMADGIRVDYQDGWFHVRPSNTEPIGRLIAEAGTDEGARQLRDDRQRHAVAAGHPYHDALGSRLGSGSGSRSNRPLQSQPLMFR